SPVDTSIQAKTDAAAVRAAAAGTGAPERGQGSIPAEVKLRAGVILDGPPVDWRSTLARSARQSIHDQIRFDDYAYQRPSRFQPCSPGGAVAHLPGMIQLESDVVFIADTSGSMGADQDKIISQGKRILGSIAGGRMRFIACDAAVHRDL